MRPAEKVTANRTIRKNGSPVLSFGEDDDGEVYLLTERDILKFASPAIEFEIA